MYVDLVDLVGPITDIEIIAAGPAVRQISRLRRQYGRGRWRKLKGIATVSTRETRFAICVENRAAEDLEVRKVYRVLRDDDAAASGYLRVIDESGEDYLYPAHYFAALELPQKAKRAWTSSRGPAKQRSSSNKLLQRTTARVARAGR